MKKTALKAVAVLAIVSCAFAFKAHKSIPNLFVKNSLGQCIQGCSSTGTTPCPVQAYAIKDANGNCQNPVSGFEADR